MNVNTIQCNCTTGQALEKNSLTADRDAIRILGLPKYLFKFRAEIERPIIANREITISITVDLLTGTSRRTDSYPKHDSKELSSSSLLTPRINREIAIKKARAKARQRVGKWSSVFGIPAIALTRENLLYKLFWLIPSLTAPTVTAIDSISGEIVAHDIKPDEVSQIKSQ